MNAFSVKQIGVIQHSDVGSYIKLHEEYIPAMVGLEGFGYIQIIWWFSGCDNESSRSRLSESKPYKQGPEILGTFATRSPKRPNPIALSSAYVTYIDQENGVIGLAYIDAEDGSPVLDIKPYTPSLDRVENPQVPSWCAHWPNNIESSGDFNWEEEFNF